MTSPTRQEIIDAHNALEDLKNVALCVADFSSDADTYLLWKEQILAALPPRPQPTMAEVEWDDDKHLLAEAEHSAWGKVIMLGPVKNGELSVLSEEEGRLDMHLAFSSNLTPTGKRYTLTEVQE